MSTASIPNLPRIISLTGKELLEVAQLQGAFPLMSYVSRSATAAQLALLASEIVATGPTQVAADTPSGAQNNYTVNGQMGPTIGFIELSPTANCNITGLEAGFDGQIALITNLVNTATVTLNALNSASAGLNRFRLPANRDLTQYNSQAFKYSAAIGLWVGF